MGEILCGPGGCTWPREGPNWPQEAFPSGWKPRGTPERQTTTIRLTQQGAELDLLLQFLDEFGGVPKWGEYSVSNTWLQAWLPLFFLLIRRTPGPGGGTWLLDWGEREKETESWERGGECGSWMWEGVYCNKLFVQTYLWHGLPTWWPRKRTLWKEGLGVQSGNQSDAIQHAADGENFQQYIRMMEAGLDLLQQTLVMGIGVLGACPLFLAVKSWKACWPHPTNC